MALPPGQPGGPGLGMMNKALPLHQVPVQPAGPQIPGISSLGQQVFSSWPRYAGPGHVLPGITSAFPHRYNGGGGGGSPPSNTAGMAAKQGESLSRTNLYIRGLSPHTTDKDLINLCQKFGPIISTKAILDKATNRCKGYGFVDFESPTSALAAVNELQGQGIQAQMARQAEQDPTNLYIANLPHSVKESDLESMFSPYGQVISTRILRDSNQLSRGTSRRKTAVSSPDPTWSGQASTDGSENALSPESRHSNGSAIGLAGSPVVQSFGYGPGPGRGLGGYVMTQSRMMSPASATGSPLVAGQPGTAWVPTSAGGYIIQSPSAAINPIEVFPLSSPVDPYTCLVSGMQGLTLGQGYNGPSPAHPAAQFVQGPLGYQMVYAAGPGPSSLPQLDPQHSPVEQEQPGPAAGERGQSN